MQQGLGTAASTQLVNAQPLGPAPICSMLNHWAQHPPGQRPAGAACCSQPAQRPHQWGPWSTAPRAGPGRRTTGSQGRGSGGGSWVASLPYTATLGWQHGGRRQAGQGFAPCARHATPLASSTRRARQQPCTHLAPDVGQGAALALPAVAAARNGQEALLLRVIRPGGAMESRPSQAASPEGRP